MKVETVLNCCTQKEFAQGGPFAKAKDSRIILFVEAPSIGEGTFPAPHLLPVTEEKRVCIHIYPTMSVVEVSKVLQ
jgi:hypothetical protein